MEGVLVDDPVFELVLVAELEGVPVFEELSEMVGVLEKVKPALGIPVRVGVPVPVTEGVLVGVPVPV